MQSSRAFRVLLRGVQQAAKERPAERLLPQEPQVSKLPNGVVVASVENYSPVAQLAVAYRAGPRDESEENVGVSHCIRVLADQSSSSNTGFGLTRSLQQEGASLTTTTGREMTVYSLECLRSSLEKVTGVLGSAASAPAFKPWEVQDNQARLELEVNLMRANPETVLSEKLYQAAFRETLGRSLYAPSFMVGKYSQEMLLDFVSNNYTGGRAAVVGLGMTHQEALDLAHTLQVPAGPGTPGPKAAYAGGESRESCGSELAYVALGVQGASSTSKEGVALSVLQQVLGAGPSVKYSAGNTLLASAAAASTPAPFAVSAFNACYSDAGLFGVSLAASADDAGKVVGAVYKAMTGVAAGSGLSDKDIARAKAQLKARLLMGEECGEVRVQNMAAAALSGEGAGIPTAASISASVDAVTPADVAAVAKRLSGKLSMAAVGNLKTVPHVDQLA